MKTTICQIARFRRRSAPIRPDPSRFGVGLVRDDGRQVAALCERGVSRQEIVLNVNSFKGAHNVSQFFLYEPEY